MEYLYHYTSLETFALIVKNKTLCFNNLLNVDDLEEAMSKDMGAFGRFVYVSCWTDDAEESIPLWNLYTPDMHGVRIRLPINPFEKYYYKKGELFFEEDTETYINCQRLYDENKMSIVANSPVLTQIEYTNENDKLYPQVKKESFSGATQIFLKAQSMEDLKGKEVNVNYSFEKVGKYKRNNWSFQREWRYIITVSPMGLKEMNPPTLEKQQEMIKRIEDRNSEVICQRLFLNLSKKAFDDFEVIFGPKMTEAEKIMAEALIKQYAPKCKYRDSNLMIR